MNKIIEEARKSGAWSVNDVIRIINKDIRPTYKGSYILEEEFEIKGEITKEEREALQICCDLERSTFRAQ